MRFADVSVRETNTFQELGDAISSIEEDYRNYIGGQVAWFSGRQVYLLKGAERKLIALSKKQDAIVIDE